MTAATILIWSLCLGGAGLALLGIALVWRILRVQQAGVRLEEVVKDHAAARFVVGAMPSVEAVTASSSEADVRQMQQGTTNFLGFTLPKWQQSAWAQVLLPNEDRMLLEQAGIGLSHGFSVYVSSRLILAFLLPVLALSIMDVQGLKALMTVFFGLGIGLMLPKWVVQSMASKRRKRVGEELPLFVDMLRLLQGVGLSLDQSMHILANEFGSVLKVIGTELVLVNRLYATGRSREQSFQRLIALSGDEDMAAVVNLLVQVDKHGGAVQEPLAQFAQRLRTKRQAAFKEKIGTITVKMTAVMVLTLLPALIVITAGPGFMAVMRSLSGMK